MARRCCYAECKPYYPCVTSTTRSQIVDSADVHPGAVIGADTTVWDAAQIRERAVLGRGCVVGRGVYVGPGVCIGDHVKIQNHALVYEPATIGDGVFIGPAAVLTNDLYPRAVNPDGRPRRQPDWQAVGVTVRTGASLGAGSVCVAPVTIGRWALVAAGSVVTTDVLDFALVAGVPARRRGWVGRAGVPLEDLGAAHWRCPQTEETYVESDGTLAIKVPHSTEPDTKARTERAGTEIS